MTADEPNLRVRINQIDYTVEPAGLLDNTVLPKVPVIRIYGESSAGEKACVHVHQVYPYFFVEYLGKMSPADVNQYIAKLSHSLNHAISLSLKRNPNSRNSQFVRAIILVKGVHFYGFHASYSPFLKIHIADPALVNRAVTLMRSGSVMKTRFRVFESHLSFVLQFLSDFGLYGCGWIDLAELWARGQDEAQDSSEGSSPPFKSRPSPYYRQTRMPLELDVAAHQILNRHRLSARTANSKLTIPAPPLPEEPVVLSVRELWEDERRRRVQRGLSPSPPMPKDPSERSRGPGGGWSAEARLWDEFRKRIERERQMDPAPIEEQGWERWVMTTFESLEALWEDQWRVWRPRPRDAQQQETQVNDSAAEMEENPYEAPATGLSSQPERGRAADVGLEVDEDMLSSQELSLLVEREEQEFTLRQEETVEADEVAEAERAAEEGPPPEEEYGENTPVKAKDSSTSCEPMTPFKMTPSKLRPLKRGNPFEDAWDTVIPSRQSPATPRPYKPAPSYGPVLDASAENPFLDDSMRNVKNDTSESSRETSPTPQPFRPTPFPVPVLDASLENPFLDDTMRAAPTANPVDGANETEFVAEDDGSAVTASSVAFVDLPETPKPRKRRRLDILKTPVTGLLTSSQSTPKGTPFPRLTPRITQSRSFTYSQRPPTTAELLATLDYHGIPNKIYQDPFYSNEEDAPDHPREYAGLVYHLKGGVGIGVLEDWVGHDRAEPASRSAIKNALIYGWEYAGSPPSVKQTRRWLENNPFTEPSRKRKNTSQIMGPTQANRYGIKSTPPIRPSPREKGGMTALALEVFAPSESTKLPDPGLHELVAIFYALYDSNYPRLDHSTPFQCQTGVLVVDNAQLNERRLRDWPCDVLSSELDLINHVVDVIQELDPDIIVGWEVQTASWGYLSARASTYGLDLGEQISRAPGRARAGESDQWGLRTTSTFRVIGRHVLNLWRIMRSELSLSSYTFENAVFHVLHRRTPRYPAEALTEWYNSSVPEHTSRLIGYFSSRTTMVAEMMEVAEVITKNSEFARVFGVDFFSVLSRGSQFKVESFMFRIAKPESYVLLSPSKQDVGKQNAAECMPLIMEPLSAFYNSPLVVLDFQSLYPSVMIAYNYCYSTCLGRVVDFKGQNKFGVSELHNPPGLLDTLKDYVNISPNGMVFVKPVVRKGLLGRMLTELLDTRVMVKQAMKSVKDGKVLTRVLEARQLSLKFIANVTYGYTSATFSGRMPAVEIADAIVQTGRETLEKAIRLIDSTPKWGARVVYGDTDSLFIYLRGKTKEQAFRIGQDIADTVTAMNPAPIKLKFEKVYLPCVLMAKKRYVGFKYENPDDEEPGFDAKGIETVRRDGVPAQQKMTETCLKILFRTQDLSQVKDYCCTTWAQILENRVSIQDFIFAKEVRLGTYSNDVPPPPGVAVATRRMLDDPNDEPQYGDRIPYVVVRGAPGARLVDRAQPPEALLAGAQLRLDAAYYISRVLVPPLERVFSLVGADVRAWFDEMPRARRVDEQESVVLTPRKRERRRALMSRFKIDEHFWSARCLTCGAPAEEESAICDVCCLKPQETIGKLLSRVHRTEKKLQNVHLVCTSCSGIPQAEPVRCTSLDCPWLFERKKLEHKAENLNVMQELVEELIELHMEDDTPAISSEDDTSSLEYLDEPTISSRSPSR